MEILKKKHWLLLISAILLLQWLFGSPNSSTTEADFRTSKTDSILVYAESLMGTKYVFGGKKPQTGFDCSGFVYHVMHKFGVMVPRSSREYANYGKKVSKEDAKPGDIVVFTGTNSKQIGHVGIVISRKGAPVEFIHASSSKKHPGVVVNKLEKSYYSERFVYIKRVIE